MAYKDESVAFRFLTLSPNELGALRELRSDVTSRSARGREGRITGVFDLREGEDYGWVKDFIKTHSIASTEHGLFVSISTNSDSDIVRVPQFAVDLIRQVGGIIDSPLPSWPRTDQAILIEDNNHPQCWLIVNTRNTRHLTKAPDHLQPSYRLAQSGHLPGPPRAACCKNPQDRGGGRVGSSIQPCHCGRHGHARRPA